MRHVASGLGVLLLVLFVFVVHRSYAHPPSRIFPETGYMVREPFLSFWERGGVQLFGYPISPEIKEENADSGQVYTVQYFERVRLEAHPGEAVPVQLGRLGVQRLAHPPAGQQEVLPPAIGALATQVVSSTGTPCLPFAQTNYALCGPFADRWRTAGGMPILGYPLTPPVVHRTADGRLLVVQYTERARLEIDPTSQNVSLGLLGRELYVPKPDATPPAWTPDPLRAHLIDLINQERNLAGLPPLAPAAALMAAAQAHSQDMATSGIVSHIGSDGRTARQRIQAAGYAGIRYAENIAVSQATPELAMQFWMHSTAHRANLLDPGMEELGVGYVQQGGAYGHYWTITFGER